MLIYGTSQFTGLEKLKAVILDGIGNQVGQYPGNLLVVPVLKLGFGMYAGEEYCKMMGRIMLPLSIWVDKSLNTGQQHIDVKRFLHEVVRITVFHDMVPICMRRYH